MIIRSSRGRIGLGVVFSGTTSKIARGYSTTDNGSLLWDEMLLALAHDLDAG